MSPTDYIPTIFSHRKVLPPHIFYAAYTRSRTPWRAFPVSESLQSSKWDRSNPVDEVQSDRWRLEEGGFWVYSGRVEARSRSGRGHAAAKAKMASLIRRRSWQGSWLEFFFFDYVVMARNRRFLFNAHTYLDSFSSVLIRPDRSDDLLTSLFNRLPDLSIDFYWPTYGYWSGFSRFLLFRLLFFVLWN